MRDASSPVSLTIFNNYLVTTSREMGLALCRAAYSPLFAEARDFATGVFDGMGDIVGHAEHQAAQLGAVVYVVKWLYEKKGADYFQRGDVILHNDPYTGGTHIPEFAVIAPIFYDDELAALSFAIGHMTEVGGKVPGCFCADSTEIFHEGMRVPAVKLIDAGKENSALVEVLAANVRTPQVTLGDLYAMVGSLRLAERRVHALLDKYGLRYFREVMDCLKDYSERRMRAEIASIPDGVYEEDEEILDNDGVEDRPMRLHVKITVAGDGMTVDYTGTDKQGKGPVNNTEAGTASATFNALFNITASDIPSNAGRYRPVKIIAPLGTLVNVEYPGSCVGGNPELHPHIVPLIWRALAPVLRERVAAADGGTQILFTIGGKHHETGELFVGLSCEACGWGGRATKDGNDALGVICGNVPLTPLEVFETRYPLLHHRYELVKDSGGAGRFRGGLGTLKELEVLCDELRVSTFAERLNLRPWGLFGGKAGSRTQILVKRVGEIEFRTFKEAFGTRTAGKVTDIHLKKGDRVLLVTPGGGGFGDPRERDRRLVEQDLAEGWISGASAESDYGYLAGRSPTSGLDTWSMSSQTESGSIGRLGDS